MLSWQTSTITLKCRRFTKLSVTVWPAPTVALLVRSLWLAARPVVSTTQYWPGTMLVNEQLPLAFVVHVWPVVVSSLPCGAGPPSGGLSTNRVNTTPANGLPLSSALWILMLPRARLLKVHVTVSPGETLMLLTGLPSLQVAPVRSQPAGGLGRAVAGTGQYGPAIEWRCRVGQAEALVEGRRATGKREREAGRVAAWVGHLVYDDVAPLAVGKGAVDQPIRRQVYRGGTRYNACRGARTGRGGTPGPDRSKPRLGIVLGNAVGPGLDQGICDHAVVAQIERGGC